MRPSTTNGSVTALLAAARRDLQRLTPNKAIEAQCHGVPIVDIRPRDQRRLDGEVPGATAICRNVLEWRLDPSSPGRHPVLARPGARVILLCREGNQSSLAAATLRSFDLDATDVVGGFLAWRTAGLPVGYPPE